MKRNPEQAARIEQAIALRAAGHTYEQIARACGYGHRGAAYHAVHRELRRRVDRNIDALRLEESAMLDALQAQLYPLIFGRKRPLLWAVDRLLKVVDARCKLYGLYSPPARVRAQAPAPQVELREV